MGYPPTPEGWEDDWPIDEIYYLMFECQRISVGPFERGPIRGVMEHYSAANQPASCLEGDYDRPSMMANLWINDADVAAYLKGLGMPARFSDITIESQPVGDVMAQTWTWQEAGTTESSWMAFPRHGVNMESNLWTERVFWFTQDRLGVMDLIQDLKHDAGTTASGVLAPPSLYAQGQATPYLAAKGGLYDSMAMNAELHLFGDFQCKQPV